jgi:hypothetical protein
MVGMCTTGALKALIYIAEPQAKADVCNKIR